MGAVRGSGLIAVRQVLRQEGVEERVAHPDGRPAEPHQARRQTQLAAAKQRSQTCAGELVEAGLQDALGGQRRHRATATVPRRRGVGGPRDPSFIDHGVEDSLGQPRFRPVAVCKPLHHRDGLGLSPARKQILWALEQMKHKEAHCKHGECNDPNGKYEPAPPLVHGPAANEPPRKQAAHKLADRPPHAQQREQAALRVGQELEEQRAVDGQVAADAEAQQCEEEADEGPRGRVGDEQAKERGDEERCIEGDAAAEDVGANAPGEGAEAEPEVEP